MVKADQWSKVLFNNAHLLSVAAAIARAPIDDVVTSMKLQRQLSLGQSTVHRVLSVLEEVELLERLDRRARTAPLRFRRVEHPFWAASTDLVTSSLVGS